MNWLYIIKALLIIIIIWLFIKWFLYKIEHRCVFQPIRLPKKHDYKLGKLQLDDSIRIYEVTIPVKQKKDYINGIYFYNPNAKYHIIYAHGNSGNIGYCLNVPSKLTELASVILFDYRGYGKSSNFKPIEERDLYEDILEVWGYTINTLGISPDNIILYGNSLGGSVVAWLGQYLCTNNKQKPFMIIMQASFSSLKKILIDLFPAILSYMLTMSFDTEKYIDIIGNNIRMCIFHSHDDELIKIHHKDNLIKTNSNIVYHRINGTHNNPDLDDIYNKLKNMLL